MSRSVTAVHKMEQVSGAHLRGALAICSGGGIDIGSQRGRLCCFDKGKSS